jgi:DNA invertase Pin-like site-specific DNA recombinase
MVKAPSKTMGRQQGEPWGVCVRISYVKDGSMLGVERQQPDCEALVRREGGHVAKVYVRNDTTAFDPKKFPFPDALEDLRTGVVKGLVAWQFDRFTRRVRHAIDLLDTAEAVGGKLATVGGAIDPSTAAGRFNARNIANVAEFESDLRSERLQAKHKQLAESGLPKGGGWRAFGYQRNGKALNKREAKLIQEAAQRLLDGESTASLLKDWQRRGITSPAGKPWGMSALRRMLTSPRVVGLRQHRGVVLRDADGNEVQAKWPAILSRGEWDRLKVLLSDPGRRRAGATQQHWLSGIVKCARCGHVLYAHPDRKGYLRYACGSNGQGCGSISISKKELDSYVERRLLDWLNGPGLARARRALADQNKEEQAIRNQLHEDEALLDQLSDWLADGTLDPPRYRRQQERITKRIEAGQRRLATMPKLQTVTDLPTVAEELEAAWPLLPLEKQREVIKSVIKRFQVRSGRPGARFDSSRVVLVFKDRDRPEDKAGWRAGHDAGVRDQLPSADLPHETDPGVLDSLAKSMNDTQETS